MDVLSNPIIATILFLGILVLVHEAGHFLVGKWSGIAVEIFSIGFGPVLFSFNRGETNYRISAIPLGGFVKFYGMVPSEPVPDLAKGREFHRAPLLARFATIAAGPIANFILAILAFTLIGIIGVQHPKAIIGEIMEDSPAEKAGLQFMDVITEVNGAPINHWRDLQRVIADNPEVELNAKVTRIDGSQADIVLIPEEVDDPDLAKTKGRIGISPNFLPSIVTVAKNNVAKEAGLKTGHRVTYIKANESEYPIKYFRQIPYQIDLILAQGPMTHLVLGVRDTQLEESNIEQITIPLLGVSFQTGAELLANLGITDSQLTIADPGKEVSQLEKGDYLIAWNGIKIDSIFGLNEIVMDNRLQTVDLTILRDGKELVVNPSLKAVDMQKIEGKVTIYTLPTTFMGLLEQGELVEERYSNPVRAMAFGFKETVNQTKMIAGAVIGLFTGDMPLKALGGPIAIAKVASDSVKMGFLPFLSLLALISINLGLFNLIPIPILDGGQLLLLSAEGVARRPLPEAAIEGFQKVGFVMVLALIAMATYNDLGRFWASMMKGFSTLF